MTASTGEPAAIRFDDEGGWAWCGDRRLELTPKALAVLRHLATYPLKLITKDDLLEAVWQGTVVSDAALASCLRDLRKVLGDSSREPRYIQTVHRRGFRFIGPLVPAPEAVHFTIAGDAMRSSARVGRHARRLFGRDRELALLHDRLARAQAGQRQVVFVTGEPGIGKTALVDAFLNMSNADAATIVARGQCVGLYGTSEPYLPLLEALTRLGRSARASSVLAMLRQHAPTWLVQLPGLLSDDELDAVRHRAQGAHRERLLREFVDALEALAHATPVTLVLEDMHWGDASTVDALSMLASRHDASRLLVIVTFRPADVVATAHPIGPLARELVVRERAHELALDFLSGDAVAAYLDDRFQPHALPPEFAALLHARSDGNPLFLVSTVDELCDLGHLTGVDGTWRLTRPLARVATGTPRTLQALITEQFNRLLPFEQSLLALASVAGVEWAGALAASGADAGTSSDDALAGLVRRGLFLRRCGVTEWPDGTVSDTYAFVHAAHQRVVYGQLATHRRIELHRLVGERLERAFAAQSSQIAGELASHFEASRDIGKAIRYRAMAGDQALRRHAHRAAADHARHALQLLAAAPPTLESAATELKLQVLLGTALTVDTHWAAPEVARTFARAQELCATIGESVAMLPVMLGLGRYHMVKGDLAATLTLAERMMRLAEASGDAGVRVAAYHTSGSARFYGGEFGLSATDLARAVDFYDPTLHSPGVSAAFRVGQDPAVSALLNLAWVHWIHGYPQRMVAEVDRALALADSLAIPFTRLFAYHFAAACFLSLGDVARTSELEDRAGQIAEEHAFGVYRGPGNVHRGWLLARQGRVEEGIRRMAEGVAFWRENGAEMRLPIYLAFQADACLVAGKRDAARTAIADGLDVASRTGQRGWDAELHRLRGMVSTDAADAQTAFLDARAIAHRQGARTFELRATASLARQWKSAGRLTEARDLLAASCNWFEPSAEMPDLSEARALLAELI